MKCLEGLLIGRTFNLIAFMPSFCSQKSKIDSWPFACVGIFRPLCTGFITAKQIRAESLVM